MELEKGDVFYGLLSDSALKFVILNRLDRNTFHVEAYSLHHGDYTYDQSAFSLAIVSLSRTLTEYDTIKFLNNSKEHICNTYTHEEEMVNEHIKYLTERLHTFEKHQERIVKENNIKKVIDKI